MNVHLTRTIALLLHVPLFCAAWTTVNRRTVLSTLVVVVPPTAASAAEGGMDVDDFLRSGMVSMPMGVSGQAGKSKPETGVILRDGTELSRDPRTGNVLAEILLQSSENKDEPVAIVTSFASPWPLATGSVFDVECRDANTGDSAFMAVTPNVKGESISDLKDSFFVDTLFAPTGRFSFYGAPTDVKVRKSSVGSNNGADYKTIDLSFATLSQSTQTEIPRRARIVATIPPGAAQAVMLVGSASALRWSKKGADVAVANTMDSFRASAAPQTSLRLKKSETQR